MAALHQFAGCPGVRLLLAAMLGATIAGAAAAHDAAAATQGWATAPAPVLHWTPCTGAVQAGFECATAQAPLDYANPRDTRTVTLALVRHRATDQAHRIGTLFFNPGGPGGAGTVILPLYFNLPTSPTPIMFPMQVRERFDIVSWDPRGVGASTSVLCYATAQKEAEAIARIGVGFPQTAAQRKAYIEGWAGVAAHCATSRSAYLLTHVSTADTARDLDLLRRAVGDAKLTYQGNSYGTLLGAVYANLYPDRVRAMVLLGNDEPVGYTNSGNDTPRLDVSLRQNVMGGTAETLNAFFKLCGQASTQQCAFSGGSAAATRAKWESVLQRLGAHPLTVDGITYTPDLVVTLAVVSLYEVSPGFIGFDWQWLASLLQPLAEGSTDPADYPAFPDAGPGGQRAVQLLAVICAEAPNPRDAGAYLGLANLSIWRAGAVGPYWVWRDEQCAAWPAIAADRYNGPWNRHTGTPILLMNTTHDPATPYSEAVSMAKALGNARLLKIEGYGHADAAVASTCADRYESDYFIGGTLPPKGAVCGQDSAPFGAPATAPSRRPG